MTKRFLSWIVLISGCLAATAALSQPTDFDDFVTGEDFVLRGKDLVIRDNQDRIRMRFDAQTSDIRIFGPGGNLIALFEQRGRNLWIGGHNRGGDLVLLPRAGTDQTLDNASIHFDGTDATQRIGGGGVDGRIVLRDGQAGQRIFLNGANADALLGGAGADGDVVVRDNAGQPTLRLDGQSGRLQSNQIVSHHSGTGPSDGVDSASVFVRSANPSIGLLDETGGNRRGWYVQAGQQGNLVFSTGDTNGLTENVMVLEPDGAVCLGAC